MLHPIDPFAFAAYVVACAALVLKYAVLIAIQGKTRARTRKFRWAEDAAASGGTSSDGEHPASERAQHALRNDGESQPYLLFAALVWVWSGAPVVAAGVALGAYVAARSMHSWLMLHPRQPLRTRVFVVGQVILFGILVDAIRRTLG